MADSRKCGQGTELFTVSFLFPNGSVAQEFDVGALSNDESLTLLDIDLCQAEIIKDTDLLVS